MHREQIVLVLLCLFLLPGVSFRQCLTRLNYKALQLESVLSNVRGSFAQVKELSSVWGHDVRSRYLPRTSPSRGGVVKTQEEALVTSGLMRELLPFGAALFAGTSLSAMTQTLQPLQLLAEAETGFLLYCFMLTQLWLDSPVPIKEWTHDRSWAETWNYALTTVPDAREWFLSWFIDDGEITLRFEDITLQDATDFLTWAMFSSEPSQISADKRQEVAQAVHQIESFTSHSFRMRQPNEQPLRSMRSTIEPLRHFHKPLMFYLVTQGLFGLGLSNEMRRLQFQEHQSGDFKYFLKRAEGATATSTTAAAPIFFLHGVGGLAAYLPLIQGLSQMGRDVVAVEMSYVSLHVSPNVPTIDQHVALLREVRQRHGYADRKVVLIGHSWGTNVMSWLIKASPDAIQTAVFLDPVNFMLHLRDITYAWFYERDRLDSVVVGADGSVARSVPLISVSSVVSLVKTELFAVNALQRPLAWFRNSLFAPELERTGIESLAVVSTNDHIVPHAEVVRHISEHRSSVSAAAGGESCVNVKQLQGADHGGLVFEESFRCTALDLIRETIARGEQRAKGGSRATMSTAESVESAATVFVN